ncbi:MAG: hypothetical protein FWE74_07990 [Oscillospiraceae bacterium]|nr:hypothetical protein [Oscillospiraceae bacterium]
MANTVYAHCVCIYLRGFEHGEFNRPALLVYTPAEYTLFDVIQMIKLLTGYFDKYTWQVTLTLGRYEPHNEMILNQKGKRIDEIRLNEFATVNNELIINYGPMKFDINNKGGNAGRNQSKKYPVMYLKRGVFPTEEEYESGKPIENMDKSYSKDELKEIDEKLKGFFKDRMKKPEEFKCCDNIECKIS